MAGQGNAVALDSLDWRALVRPGDLVVWGQASAEPVGLTASLMRARAAIGGFRAFVGISYAGSVHPDHADHVAFASYCGTANNRSLGPALDILPVHYGRIAPTLAMEKPVVLLSVARGSDPEHFSLAASGDYIGDLIPHARLVIAEVSEAMPRTGQGRALRRDQIDVLVASDSVPPDPGPRTFGAAEQAIARHVAGLIEDGSTLQVGLGGMPAAILQALSGHRDLGIHSGLIGDEVAELAMAGVITNARKTIDLGWTVTGLLSGSDVLMRWADGNAALAIHRTSYTHSPAILAKQDRFVAINSAIEVDLTGQVNAEVAGGHYVGAVGGGATFLRGAAESHGGLPLIALPSTAGKRSRIVRRLSGPVSVSRADAGIVVTEHGIADLRHLGLRARREKLLQIASPVHRAALDASEDAPE